MLNYNDIETKMKHLLRMCFANILKDTWILLVFAFIFSEVENLKIHILGMLQHIEFTTFECVINRICKYLYLGKLSIELILLQYFVH